MLLNDEETRCPRSGLQHTQRSASGQTSTLFSLVFVTLNLSGTSAQSLCISQKSSVASADVNQGRLIPSRSPVFARMKKGEDVKGREAEGVRALRSNAWL